MIPGSQQIEVDQLEMVAGGPLPAAVVYVGYAFGGFSAGRAAMELAIEIVEMFAD